MEGFFHRQMAAIKPITIPPSNTDGIEHVLVAAGKHLEKNKILRARKWEANAEEFVMVGPFKRDLLERERRCDQIELKMSSPKSQCSRRQQSFLLNRFVQFKASRSRSGDQRLRLGSRQKDDGISIGIVRGSPTATTASPPMTRYRTPSRSRNENANRQKSSN